MSDQTLTIDASRLAPPKLNIPITRELLRRLLAEGRVCVTLDIVLVAADDIRPSLPHHQV